MKKLLLPVVISFYCSFVTAQTKEGDSLTNILNNYHKEDTAKLNLLNSAAYAYITARSAKAVDLADRSIKLAQALNNQEKLAKAYSVKGSAHHCIRDNTQAIAYFTKSLDLYDKLHNSHGVLDQYKEIINIYGREENQYALTNTYTLKALAFCDRLNLVREKATFLYGGGINWMYQNDFVKAQDYLEQAVTVAHETGNKKVEANSYMGLGIMQKSLGDNARSLENLKKSLVLNEQLNDKNGIAGSLNNLAVLSTSMANYNDALVYLQRAADLNEQMGNEEQAMINFNNIAYAYEYLNNYSKALEYFKKELPFWQTTNDKAQVASILSDMANMYTNAPDSLLRMNGIDPAERNLLAIKYLKENIALLRETNGTKELVREALVQLSAAYAKQKDFENALIIYRQYIDVRDSIVDVEKQKEVARREMQFAFGKTKDSLSLQQQLTDAQLLQQKLLTTQKEQQLQLAEKEKAAKELQNKYETSIKNKQIESRDKEIAYNKSLNIVLSTVGLSVLLITGFIYYNLRKTSKLNRTVSLQRDALSKQSEALSVMMKELHHRVKNNLQIVSSLLNLQSMRLTDEGAISAVQESKNRVQAMSLIHQRLYKTDDITRINMKEYIKELADFLATSYGYGPDNFTLKLNTEEEWVDIDKALPLGLILNELLTNAFKYAFAGIEKPSLSITFKHANGNFTLLVKDNGKGIEPGEWDDKRNTSFGRQLVKALCNQLRAKEKLEVMNGTSFTFTIPEAA